MLAICLLSLTLKLSLKVNLVPYQKVKAINCVGVQIFGKSTHHHNFSLFASFPDWIISHTYKQKCLLEYAPDLINNN